VTAWLSIIGVGETGVAALPPAMRALVLAAETVLGPARLLATTVSPARHEQGGSSLDPRAVQEAKPTQPVGGPAASAAADLVPWAASLPAMLEQVLARRGTPTVILATGDPMWFGIGATLARHLPSEEFTIYPAPGAFQLAAARLRWPLQHAATLSLHGRAVETLHPHVLPGNRVLALTSDRSTLTDAAKLLIGRGYGESRLVILEHLGGADERLSDTTAAAFDPAGIGDFHVLAIDCVADAEAALLPPVPGLPDGAFVSDGQLSKREVRAATLARLAPYPGALLWDVGAGCGSVAIEWLRAARDARALAFERNAARRDTIATNARALGTPGLEIIAGDAPGSLAGHASPDAVFMGGDVANVALFEACWRALRPGGRLVANAVTLDGEAALYARQERLGGELVRLEIAVLDHIGGAERVLRPRLPVTQWLAVKP